MSNYSVPEEVVFRQLGEETVLVHLGTSEIYRLNETGARIWELLSSGAEVASIEETLVADYDVDRNELQAQIETLVTDLVESGLLCAPNKP